MKIQQRNEREEFVRVIIHAIIDLSKVEIMNNRYYLHACGAGCGVLNLSNGLQQDEYFHHLQANIDVVDPQECVVWLRHCG